MYLPLLNEYVVILLLSITSHEFIRPSMYVYFLGTMKSQSVFKIIGFEPVIVPVYDTPSSANWTISNLVPPLPEPLALAHCASPFTTERTLPLSAVVQGRILSELTAGTCISWLPNIFPNFPTEEMK